MRISASVLACGLALAVCAHAAAPSATLQTSIAATSARAPEPPRETVSVELPPTTRVVRVPEGGNLQEAIDRAMPGDRIVLTAGVVYRGPFRLPNKAGESGWIVIASDQIDARLPKSGERVGPDDARAMPRLTARGGAVLVADRGAHHYRLEGIEIAPADDTFLYQLVELGNAGEADVTALPHHIVLDRCYVHGDPRRGSRRGVALNSAHTAIINSHFADFKEVGADSQAIAGWNGPGPYLISNNYLEGAGENVMFGGADPSIDGLVPSDIEIVGNHMAKPLRWRKGDPQFEGTHWSIKNLFELKSARRVRIEHNVFEYNWEDAQNGFAILFTPRNQDGDAPWSVVSDVTFAGNVIRHVGAGVNILGRDDIHRSERTERIEIRNNLFMEVGAPWGGGRMFQLLDGTSDVVIEQNTAFSTGSALFGGDRSPHLRLAFRNNVVVGGDRGIHGSGAEEGLASVLRYFPGGTIAGNVFVGLTSRTVYPGGNAFAPSVDRAGSLDRQDDLIDLQLADRYERAGVGGSRPGADLVALADMARRVAPRGESRPVSRSTNRVLPLASNVRTTIEPALLAFWGAAILLFYTYVGYPMLAWVWANARPRPARKAPIQPRVSIVVAAHNEAERITSRIENLLALDYPADRLEILVASDGSSDDTARRAHRFTRLGVRVWDFADWRGKPAVLNDLVRHARGDIIVFADARQRFAPDAVRALVSNFADPTVGAVSGELILAPDSTGAAAGQGGSFYWRYEKFIRSRESRAGSAVGVTGAIYAIRRELFAPIPEDTILDDVLIPMRIARSGARVLFEPEARAYDRPPGSGSEEQTRKIRTIAGMFQLLSRETWLLNPLRDRLWLQVVSHKGLRLMLPVLHGVMLVSNVALAGNDPYRWFLLAQAAFYAAALVACVQGTSRRCPIVLSVPYAMCLLIVATVVAFGRFLMGGQPVRWGRVSSTTTARP